MAVKTARTLGEGNFMILVGPMEGKGDKLLSGKNIADYVDECGCMDLWRFLGPQQQFTIFVNYITV